MVGRGAKRRRLVAALAVLGLLALATLALLALVGDRSARSVSGGRGARSILPPGTAATLDLGGTRHGPFFARGAVGLSVEATAFAWRHLDPRRGNLAAMIRLLGSSVLRVGGNAGDLSFWTTRGEPAPAWALSTVVPADLKRLAALARATGSHVVLAVNLGHLDPGRAAGEAAAAARELGHSLLGIEIGNEPDLYPGHRLRARGTYDYQAFATSLARYRSAITAAAPGVPTVGPDFSHTDWSMRYARTVGSRNREVTQHYYPLWECPGTARPSIHALLGSRVRHDEDFLLARLNRAAAAAGRPAALSETNSVGCSGARGVSRTFASALWALDWTLRAGSAGVRQIQFHDLLERCTARTYSPLCATGPAGALRLAPQPEFYGLLAAARLENGSFVRVSLRAPKSLTAYATRAGGGTIHLALDDMSTGGAPQPVLVELHGRYRASVETLVGPSLTARHGVRLGGGVVTPSGGFRSRARYLQADGMVMHLRLAPGSAAVLTLTPVR